MSSSHLNIDFKGRRTTPRRALYRRPRKRARAMTNDPRLHVDRHDINRVSEQNPLGPSKFTEFADKCTPPSSPRYPQSPVDDDRETFDADSEPGRQAKVPN